MDSKQILEKAIQKAIDGGWEDSPPTDIVGQVMAEFYDMAGQWTLQPLNRLIFNHDFAKALWGEEEMLGFPTMPRWKSKLQQMVIVDDPIAYLGDSL